jgi:hypothetical protein
MSENIEQKPVVSTEQPEAASENNQPNVESGDAKDTKPESKETVSDVKPRKDIDHDAMVAAIAKRKAEKLAAKQTADFKSKLDSMSSEIEALKTHKSSASQSEPQQLVQHPETGELMSPDLTIIEYAALEARRQGGHKVSFVKNRDIGNIQQPTESKPAQPTTQPQYDTGQPKISDDFMAQAEWCAANVKGERAGDDFNSVISQVAKIADVDMLNAAAYASRNGALDVYELARTAEGFKKLAEIASIANPESKKFAMYELIKARDVQRQALYTSNATPQPPPLESGGKLNNYFTESVLESLKRRRGY